MGRRRDKDVMEVLELRALAVLKLLKVTRRKSQVKAKVRGTGSNNGRFSLSLQAICNNTYVLYKKNSR